jgi:hypothetical protein
MLRNNRRSLQTHILRARRQTEPGNARHPVTFVTLLNYYVELFFPKGIKIGCQ